MVISHELSQGSSSSSSLTYDVFLSFRGIDTRLNFTNHLHKALEDANLVTFLEDQEIDTTLYLKPELESAVKASRSSIIVLSKNYASSTRCLEELVLILEQHKTSSQMVFPVFYDVNPTDVRKQQNSFGDAMERHKQRMEAETNVEGKSLLAQKMVTWKKALTEVTELEGKDAKGRLETEFIEAIVTDIKRCLGVPLWSTLPDLIGMDCSVRFISSWLKDGSTHTADILTILGMDGIGKTSLAKYVYDMHHILFKRSSFVVDINRKCRDEYDKLLELQMQVLVDISETSSERIPVQFVSVYTSKIEKALARNKVLLVLDDIDSLDQLNVLLGGKGFHPGSKIIITTKDASLARRYKLSNPLVQPNHTTLSLEGLNETSSLQLLSFHAFKRIGPTEGYKQVCKKLLKFCERLPLVLKVLGCSLCDQDVAEWEEYIGGLEHETDSTYRRVLQMSFDSLPSQNDKELFKHIACFFVGMDRDYTETILKACGIRTLHGIRNLLDRCLLAIGPRNELMMHQLLQDMGKDMVRQESHDKPWKRSRLWCHKDSFNVLQQKKGKGSLKGIVLDMRMLEKENLHGSLKLRTDALSKMDNLMLLQLNYVQLKGSYKNFPKQLRWLCMHGFPSPSIPFDLQMENLVALDMSYSKIKKFDMSCSNMQQLSKTLKLTGHSKDKRLLGSLKILNLSFCEQLRSLGGFIEFPALERLIVTNCIDLTEVSESIEQCVELVIIDLSYCKKLEKLPTTLGKLKKVKKLLLHDCNLRNPPIDMRDRDSQKMARTEIFRIDSQTSSSAITEAVPHHLEFFRVSVPSSLEQYNRNVEERKEQEQELERNKREENERERIERERNKRDERIEQECIKGEENERKDQGRIEQERIKREEDERKDRGRIEQERIKREEKERNERELREQERNEREERERNECNERERESEQLLKDLNERMEQQRIEQQEKWQRQQEEERNQPRAPEKMEDHGIVKGVDELPRPSYLVVALAVNGSQKTKYVIKWALDKFVPEGILLFKLFFVHPKITRVPFLLGKFPVSQMREDVVIAYKKKVEWQADQKLLPYKNMCARRKVDVDIVHIESDDIVDAIKQEIVKQKIDKLVIGASSNGMFSRRRNLSSRISESIPSFCTVYAISEGKLSSLRASDSETVGSSKDDDNTSNSSSITNSSFAQTDKQTECCSTHLIDGKGIFNEVGLDNFIKQVKMGELGLSYAVVSIMGPQSSGKSTLLNHLFRTNFKEMNAHDGRSQTTLGVWMAKCNDIEPCTIVMDLEGNDGRERGKDDTAFEKQLALFALAVSDIVLINMWCNDIGREQAANKPLLRTIFQVMLQLFTSRKTTLLFVIRDKTDAPLEKLESLLREDTQKIWDDIPKPEAHKQTPLSDFFNIQVEALAHYMYNKEEFKEEVAILRKKFSKSIEAGGLAGDRRGVIPASGFSLSVQEIWKVIKENKDLNLPAHKVMVANLRCEEIANEEYSSFVENKEWLELKELVQFNIVPGFGKKLSSLLGDSLSSYDKESTYFDKSGKDAKREQLEEKLIHLVQPTYQILLEHITSGTLENFKKALTDALNEGKGIALAARDCTQKFMTLFDEQYQDAVIEEANWDSTKVRNEFSRYLDSHVTEVLTAKLSELTALNESKLENALIGPLEALLLTKSSDETWPRIKILLHHETGKAVSEFSSALSEFEMDEQAKEDILSKLKNHAIGIVERKAREEAAKVLYHMKDRFLFIFNHDNNLRARVWTNTEDIQAITTTARSSCLKLLSALAATRLDEGTDTIWDMLEKALGKPDGNQDILATNTWEKVPEATTLITPAECIKLWKKFQEDTEYTITQAIASQEHYGADHDDVAK